MENFNELKAMIEIMETNVVKFYEKNNKSCGPKVRKALQEIKVLAQTMRFEVSEKSKG